ncbi:MAG: lipocalin-like domain-containing protein [Methylococcaceae bacterium]
MLKIILPMMAVFLLGLLGFWYHFPPNDLISNTDPSSSNNILTNEDDAGFAKAFAPRPFLFPQDHGPHPDFKTEWWYFTGNLKDQSGQRFGYELTFFRFALTAKAHKTKSNWRSNQLYMAHLTLTDVNGERFYTQEKFSRAANGLAGAKKDRLHVWLHDWQASTKRGKDSMIELKAAGNEFNIQLQLEPLKPIMLQGDNGLSQKSDKPGNASYYYSYPRLATTGKLFINDLVHIIEGTSWMDREWSTSALSKDQIGWDWFALQLDDGTELMLYQFRRKDGLTDRHSSGTLFTQTSDKIPLTLKSKTIQVTDHWTSPHSKITYPSGWEIHIPEQQLRLTVTPLINDQELNTRFRYWEGAVSIQGTKQNHPISGQGYVELTGYVKTKP